MPETKILDLKGAICPDPLIQVQDAMKKAVSGDSYIIVVDYPLAVKNIARWGETDGINVQVEQKGGDWEIRITKA